MTLYVETMNPSQSTLDRLARIVGVIGETPLKDVTQKTINTLARKILRPGYQPATLERGIIVPVKAVMRLASEAEGWCDVPKFRMPEREEGRTLYLLPVAAERLIAAAGPSHQVLLNFILGTGARMSEALELQWADVDLKGARAIFWRTKTRRRRNAFLPPSVIVSLANLSHRQGHVIRRPDGQPYESKERQEGGQIKRAFHAIKRRAGAGEAGSGIPPELTPHDLRHTWASWHYALYKDPLRLKLEGGWASLDQVERYVHLLPQGQEDAIRAFWHHIATSPAKPALTA